MKITNIKLYLMIPVLSDIQGAAQRRHHCHYHGAGDIAADSTARRIDYLPVIAVWTGCVESQYLACL